MTISTAQFRTAARDAAGACNWQEAADLMGRAIEVHPGNKLSPLVQRDLAMMTQFRDGMTAMALRA